MPFDTVYIEYKDLGGLEAECLAARRAGFAGKLAIHPGQIQTINKAFSPAQLEIEWAKRVVAAFDADPHLGTVGIDGKMVPAALNSGPENAGKTHIVDGMLRKFELRGCGRRGGGGCNHGRRSAHK
jgi:citrate lyase beta subunit